MRTLASVLEAAIKRSAAEITLESEQPVIYRTARGSEAEQAVLARPELFDMLAAAVSDENQVELMLGNSIEFDFEIQRTKWRIRAVPGAEAMLVRVERAGAVASDEPLPEPTDDLSIELDDADQFVTGFAAPPELDDPDFDLDSPPPPPRAAPRRSPSFALGLTDELSMPRVGRQLAEPGPAAFESGTWALDDDDDPELDAHAGTLAMPASDSSAGGRLPLGFPSPPEPAYSRAETSALTRAERPTRRTVNEGPTASVDFVGLLIDDDDEPVRPASSKPVSGLAASVRAAPGRTHSELAPLASPEAETQRDLSAVGSPEADTRRELAAVARSTPDFVGLAADIGEGTLVYLLESGLAEQLASALQAPTLVLDEDTDLDQLGTRARALAPGSILVVKREDPSALLGWILRRLEEGYRVLLDTRARSPEGARRVLLGTHATERAEAWLAVQKQMVVESSEAGPRVRAPALAS